MFRSTYSVASIHSLDSRYDAQMPQARELVPALYLCCLAASSAWVAGSSWATVTGYRSTYALDRQFEAGPALADRVVLVVLDGLRTDRVDELPAMRSLASRGASGTLRVVLPSLSNPARAALVTGAWPEVSGVTNNSAFEPPPIQSLFSLARQHGIESAVIGTEFWRPAFGAHIDAIHEFSGPPESMEPADLITWQTQACDEALEHLGASSVGLTVVGLMAGDEAGHEYGGESASYLSVTAAVDECLGRLVDSLGHDATFVAVSDHGHVDRWGHGGHGGEEPEVLHAPFAMAGQGVRRADPFDAELVDIAPTLSVLLGLPIPANNQGRVLWDALEEPAGTGVRLRGLESAQREALAAHMPDRAASLAALRAGRLPVSVVAAGWFLGLVLAVGRSQRLRAYLVATAAFAAVYWLCFFFFQLGYSLSVIVRQEYLYSFFGRNVLAAALATGAASYCLQRLAAPDRASVARLAVILTSGFALMVTYTYYRHGLRMEGWMIEIGPGFKAYMDMLAICGVVTGALLVLGFRTLFSRRRADA